MALDTYTGLIETVADYLERADMAAHAPTWVALAEHRLTRRLNLAENEAMVRLDLVEGRAPLPDDYGSWRAVNATQGWSLDYEAPHTFIGRYGRSFGLTLHGQGDGYDDVANAPHGCERTFTIIGSVPLDDIESDISIWPNGLDNPFILTGPAHAKRITLIYRQRIPPLGVGNPSNWLLEKNPDAYLYATLAEAGPFLKQDASLFKGMLDEAISDITSLDRAGRWGRSRVRNLEPTP